MTIKQKEIFCEQDYSGNENAQRLKLDMAAELAYDFEFGGKEGAAIDLWKAKKYREMAGIEGPQPEGSPGSATFNSHNFYWLAGKFTKIRLGTIRTDQLAEVLGHAFLSRFFSIGGFSYFAEIIYHTAIIINSTFIKPVTDAERDLSNFERISLRFKNVLFKDNRPQRLINALVWGPLNLAAFILSGGTAVILNLIGFGIDTGLSIGFAVKNVNEHKQLVIANQNEIAHAQEELAAATGNGDKDKIEQLQKKIDGLEYANKNKLEPETQNVGKQEAWGLLHGIIVLSGMALCMFPPTAPIGAIITAAALIYGVSDIIANFSEKYSARFFNYLYSDTEKNTAASEKVEVETTATTRLKSTDETCNRLLKNHGKDVVTSPISEPHPVTLAQPIKVTMLPEKPVTNYLSFFSKADNKIANVSKPSPADLIKPHPVSITAHN